MKKTRRWIVLATLGLCVLGSTAQGQIASKNASVSLGAGLVKYNSIVPVTRYSPTFLLDLEYFPIRQFAFVLQGQYGYFKGGTDGSGRAFESRFISGEVLGRFYFMKFNDVEYSSRLSRLLSNLYVGAGVGFLGARVQSIKEYADNGVRFSFDDADNAGILSFHSGLNIDVNKLLNQSRLYLNIDYGYYFATSGKLGGYGELPVVTGDRNDKFWILGLSVGYYFGGDIVYYKPRH